MGTRIRLEEPEDADAIHRVHASSFETDGEARLVDALRADGDLTLSLVALDGDDIVGHVAFSPVTAAGAEGGLGLAPVAVLASHRRHGVAAALIREGLSRCRARGVPFVVLLGDPAYYGRFGFEPAPRHGLSDEYGGGDAFQVLALMDGGMPDGAGVVRYARAFGAL